MDFAKIIFVFPIPFVFALLVTAIATPLALKIISRLGLIDDPKLHDHPGVIHTKPVPRGGGLPLFIGILIPSIFFLPINNITIAIFIAAFLMLSVGLIDDKLNARGKDVSPYLRFVINILCAIIVVGSGVGIPFITNPFGGILHLDQIFISLPILPLQISLSSFFAILWIIWVMNVLNWSKGVDGQMPGIVAISALTIGFLSFRFPLSDPLAPMDAILSFITAGAAVGFLIYNFYPAKIFPGYGATAIYLILAIVSMLSSAKLATAILVMGVPAVDAGFTIFRRLIAKKSPFKGDRGHLHHLLLHLGYSQRQIALFYWLISAILGIVALSLDSKSKVFAIIMVLVISGGGLLFLHFIVKYTHENKIT